MQPAQSQLVAAAVAAVFVVAEVLVFLLFVVQMAEVPVIDFRSVAESSHLGMFWGMLPLLGSRPCKDSCTLM